MRAYAIKLQVGNKYAARVPKLAGSDAEQWSDLEHAIRFPTMTRATIAAIQIYGLGPGDFTIEAA